MSKLIHNVDGTIGQGAGNFL